jgi:hypothetical protein
MSKYALNDIKGERSRCIDMIKSIYPNYDYLLDKKVIVFGSYNLLITSRIAVFLNSQVTEHYMFSSLISAMSLKSVAPPIVKRHSNVFRQDMIEKDLNKSFVYSEGIENSDYVIIDFLEEINDVIQIRDVYYTNSEAHKEIEAFISVKSNISIDDVCREELWKDSCVCFIEFLRRHFHPSQIILVKYYLCETYAATPQSQTPFENVEQIRNINKILNSYYDFFINNFSGVNVIETGFEGLNYTYKYTKYGLLPQYSNGLLYNAAAEKIKESILQNDSEVLAL